MTEIDSTVDDVRPRSRELVPLPRLWFALFGAPIAWVLQETIGYAISSHFCFPDGRALSTPAWSGAPIAAFAVSCTMLLVALAALYTAIANWRQTGTSSNSSPKRVSETVRRRTRFMSFAGILVGCTFVFGIVIAAAPIVTLPFCV